MKVNKKDIEDIINLLKVDTVDNNYLQTLEETFDRNFGENWIEDKGLISLYNYSVKNEDKPLGFVNWEA